MPAPGPVAGRRHQPGGFPTTSPWVVSTRARLPSIARELRYSEAVQAVQAVQAVEDELGLPVMTAAAAATFEILQVLGHEPAISNAERHH